MTKEKSLPRGFPGFIKDHGGASFSEYALLASLVCVVSLLALLAVCKST